MKIKKQIVFGLRMVLGLLCFEVVSPKPNTTIKNRKEKIKKKKKQITTIERESERSHLYRQWVCKLTVAANSVLSSSIFLVGEKGALLRRKKLKRS